MMALKLIVAVIVVLEQLRYYLFNCNYYCYLMRHSIVTMVVVVINTTLICSKYHDWRADNKQVITLSIAEILAVVEQ